MLIEKNSGYHKTDGCEACGNIFGSESDHKKAHEGELMIKVAVCVFFVIGILLGAGLMRAALS